MRKRKRNRGFEEANPEGRLDVLAFNIIKGVVKGVERKYGIEGIWDEIQPEVERRIRRNIPADRMPIRRVTGFLEKQRARGF